MSKRLYGNGFLKVFVFVLSVFIALSVLDLRQVSAADQDPNPSEIDIYFLEDSYASVIGSIPSGYKTSYKISTSGLTGTPSFRVTSGTLYATVSSDGVITPKVTKWYKADGYWTTAYIEGAAVRTDYSAGKSVIRVTCGDYSKDITVNVKSYAGTYADNKMDTVLSQIITTGMTDLEKLTAITKWVAQNTDYSASYSSYVPMMVHMKGDCWASTYTIIKMCDKVGIKASDRRARYDAGAGSGHMNVIALCGGEYYKAEAGYSGNKPRPYGVTKEPYGFTLSGNTVTQYDGFDTDVKVPETINGKSVTKFGVDTYSAFYTDGIKSVYLPKSVTSIGEMAFYSTPDIKVTVDPASTNLTTDKGSLYSKDKSKLFFVPQNIGSITVDKNTKEIMGGAFSLTNLKRVELPDGLEKIGAGAFYNAPNLTTLSIPKTVTEIGSNAFYNDTKLQIYYEGTQDDWNNITFGTALPSAVKVHFQAVRVTGIDQNGPADITITKKGGTVNLGARVIPSNAENQEIKYVSDNTSVVKVDGSTLTAAGEGTCKVTAATTDGDFIAVYNVTVKYDRYKLTLDGGYYGHYVNNNGTSTYVKDTEVEFIEGDTLQIRNSYTSSNGLIFSKWLTDDDVQITSGSVTSTSVTVKLPGRNVTIKAVYDPVKVTNVYVYNRNTNYSYVCPDYKTQLYVTVYPSNAYDKSVTWSSTDETVIKVDAEGNVTAVAPGTASIVALAKDGSGIQGTKSFTVKDHSWDKGTVTKEPTCENEGTKLFKCTRTPCTHEKTEPVAALGHKLTEVPEVPPTDTEPGSIKHYKCDRCGKLFADEQGKKEITIEQTVIPALTHKLTKVSAKAATCTEDGNIEYYVCKDTNCGCGKLYKDKYGKEEINLSDTVVPAGHKIVQVPAKDPTCVKDGHDEYYECSVCHEKYSDAEGKNVISSPLIRPKTGHKWAENGTVTKEATCEQAGIMTYACENPGCTYVKNEPIKALGHDKEHLKHHEAKNNTYLVDGNIEYFECPRCGKLFTDADCQNEISLKETIIPKKGAAELGEKAEAGDFMYQITNPYTDGRGTVTLIGVVNKTEAVVIPLTVEIKDAVYKVNRIGVKAFYGNKTIKTLNIGANVLTIDTNAFYGCSGLVKVSGGLGLKIIGTNAFARCTKLSTFVITSKVLYKIGPYAFSKDSKLKTIYIRNTVLLTKSGVKKSLKGSKVKKVKVKKSKVKKYKKYFTKKNCGRKVKVKK